MKAAFCTCSSSQSLSKTNALRSRCVRHGVSPTVINTSDSSSTGGIGPVGDLFTVICLQLSHLRTMYKMVGRLIAANSVAFNETLRALPALRVSIDAIQRVLQSVVVLLALRLKLRCEVQFYLFELLSAWDYS